MSYTDYPQSASNNAKRALEFKEENGSSCGTPVGWQRANQLAKREAISLDTVKRTFSFLSRAETYYTQGGSLEECGNIMYLAWGGKPMKRWCESALDKENEKMSEADINKFYQKTMEKKSLDFSQKFAKFKEEGGEAPVIIKDFKVKINEGGKKVILTMEEYDRDDEIVMVDGIRIKDSKMGVPMVDSHKMNESVVQNGLGAFRNLRVEMIDGKKCLVGEPDFAPTERGKEAEILYMGVNGGLPYFDNVSIGFAVYDYDEQTRTIKESELFECSLVTVGANFGARFISKGFDIDIESEKVAKNLARFKQIHEPFKEMCKLFLSEEFAKSIGYEKDGDLLVDINGIYDKIDQLIKDVAQKQEAPVVPEPEEQEAPVSGEEIQKAINEIVNKAIKEQGLL